MHLEAKEGKDVVGEGVRCLKGASKAETGKPLQVMTSGDISKSGFRGGSISDSRPCKSGAFAHTG